MKINKLLLSGVTLLVAGVMLTACTSSTNPTSNSSEPKKAEVLNQTHKQAFEAKIKSVDDTRISVEVLKNLGSSDKTAFSEKSMVILNAKDVKLTDSYDKALKLENLNQDDKLQVILSDEPIMTMSLPPQIPGRSITQIVKL